MSTSQKSNRGKCLGFSLELSKHAMKNLSKIDKSVSRNIFDSLQKLKNNPKLGKPLKGVLSGLFSHRIGLYRIIYSIEKITIKTERVAHRRDVYK